MYMCVCACVCLMAQNNDMSYVIGQHINGCTSQFGQHIGFKKIPPSK